MLEFSSSENGSHELEDWEVGYGALTKVRQIATYQLLGQSHLGLDPAWMPQNEILRLNEYTVSLLGESRKDKGFVWVEEKRDEGVEATYLVLPVGDQTFFLRI